MTSMVDGRADRSFHVSWRRKGKFCTAFGLGRTALPACDTVRICSSNGEARVHTVLAKGGDKVAEMLGWESVASFSTITGQGRKGTILIWYVGMKILRGEFAEVRRSIAC